MSYEDGGPRRPSPIPWRGRTMSKIRILPVALLLWVLLSTLAAGGSAKVDITVMNEGGAMIEGAVILMAPSDEPTSRTSIDEGEPGRYAGKLDHPAEAADWTISKIVADGYLPVIVSIKSVAAGETIQEITGMELNPGIPIPPIRVSDKGTVRIELTLGEQSAVMAKFVKSRAEARAKAEREAAEQLAKAKEQEDYAEALKLYNEGDIAGSLPYFEKALEQKPQDIELRVMYARVLYKAGRHDDFQAAAEKALELDPGNGELRMMRYSSHRSMGDLRAALNDLLAIRASGGSDEQLLPHLQFIARSMGQTMEAVPAYQAILEIDGKDANSHLALASIYDAAGNAALSERHMAKAIELEPGKAAELYYTMATKLLTAKQPSEEKLSRAIALLNKALEHDPDYAHAYRTLGLALWKRQDWPGTRQAFLKYLELLPQAADRETIEDYLKELPE